MRNSCCCFQIFTTKIVLSVIGVSWLCAFAWAIPIVFSAGHILILDADGYMTYWNLSALYAKFEISFSGGIMVLILLCYLYVFSVVKQKREAMKAFNTNSKKSTDEIKVLIQSFIIFIGMTLVLMSSYSYYAFVLFIDENSATSLSSICNSIISATFYSSNPVLYLVFSSNIRKMVLFCAKSFFSMYFFRKTIPESIIQPNSTQPAQV